MKKCCWLPYFRSVNCIYRFWDMSYMQLLCCRNFIKSQVYKKKIIQVFSKQHGLASYSLIVGSIGWESCGVIDTSPASRGGGVSSWYQSRVLGNLCY